MVNTNLFSLLMQSQVLRDIWENFPFEEMKNTNEVDGKTKTRKFYEDKFDIQINPLPTELMEEMGN